MDKELKKQRIYDLMNGALILEQCTYPESKVVVNEFQDGMPCEKWYAEVYAANRRICARLGVEEDSDIEIMIDRLQKIAEYQCKKMYDYGKEI